MGADVRVAKVKIWKQSSLLLNSTISFIDSQGTTQFSYRSVNATGKEMLEVIIPLFIGPYFTYTNKTFARDYVSSGSYVYATKNGALEACINMTDCGGVTKESNFTLRMGLGLINSTSGEDSWLKNVSFTGPHTNKRLADYVSSGTYIYATINGAQEACKNRTDCGGVTKESNFILRSGLGLINSTKGEDSWLKNVSFNGPHTNKRLADYVSSGTYIYATINGAQEACKNRTDCGGVTKESNFTLRSGLGLINSTSGETSWVRTTTSAVLDRVGLVGTFRKVRVELEGTNILSMKEVQVFAHNGTNVALNKSATQSSVASFSFSCCSASKAVNGDTTVVGSETNNEAGK